MRMFDSFVTYIVITVLSCGVASVNLFLIYAIWKYSPKSMGKFKNYMMIMSIADFSFASSIAFLFLPNLLFPLPAGIVVGLLKYLGPIGGPISYAVTMTCGAWMMVSIWQCCLYRMYIFYQFDRLLEIANNYFAVLMILEVLVLSANMGINTWRNTISYKEFRDYAKRHGHKVSSDITPDTPLVAFDLDSVETSVGVFVIGTALCIIGICIGSFNIAVQKKINQNKPSMSKETYRMQKSLTLVLLAQFIMRMFDSFLTYIIITILSCIVALVNLFLIYAIWKHSPTTMGDFKKYMMIMSTADFLFASSIAFLFLPNLLFPLPAGIVVGLLKHIGPLGGPIAYGITVIAGGWMMLSIWQCCMYRFLVFYHFDKLLELALKYFLLLQIAQILAIVAICGATTYFNTCSYQELMDYAKRHGHKVPADLTSQTPIAAFDLDKPNVIGGVIMIGGFMFIMGIGIGIMNIAVQRKIHAARKSMSSETYRIQKSLTVILLAQAIIPGVSIVIPILLYCIAMGFSLTELHQSPILEWFSVLIIGAYPFVNSCFCLYYMKPYRQFTKRTAKKVIWCYHWSEEVVPIVEPTGSSNNPQQR